MNFPKHLDQEDMDLFQKEARLAGYHTRRLSGHDAFAGWESLVFYDENPHPTYHFEDPPIAVADYTWRRDDEIWVKTGSNNWSGVIEEVRAYEIP